MFLLVAAKFLHRGPRRRVQLPIALPATGEALIVLLDRFRSADELVLQFTPDWANHESLATIVARAPDHVQQAERGACPAANGPR